MWRGIARIDSTTLLDPAQFGTFESREAKLDLSGQIFRGGWHFCKQLEHTPRYTEAAGRALLCSKCLGYSQSKHSVAIVKLWKSIKLDQQEQPKLDSRTILFVMSLNGE